MITHVFVLIAAFCVQTQGWRYTTRTETTKLGSYCQLKYNGFGVCALLQNCEPLIKKQVRYEDLKRCSFVEMNEVVCCPRLIAPTTMGPIIPTSDFAVDMKNSDDKRIPRRRPAKIACDVFCEKNPDRITSRLFGQRLAVLGEFAHIGAMIYHDYTIRCEASLIAAGFALTAASCVDADLPIMIRFGMTELNPREKKKHQVDAKIKRVMTHSEYRTGSPLHDIAIIEFTEEVVFSPFISPACLRSEDTDLPSLVNLKVAGWNKVGKQTSGRQLDLNRRINNQFLLSANLTTIQLNACINGYRNYLNYKRFLAQRNEGLYCTIESKTFNIETCYGDPGGPLMVDTEELWEIVGIASFANPCGVRVPNVFIRVSHYLDWIEDIVWPPKHNSIEDHNTVPTFYNDPLGRLRG